MLETEASYKRAVASGFTRRTHCSAGHDLKVTGYSGNGWNSGQRCRVCDEQQRRNASRISAEVRLARKGNQ